jgi:hypothetical protein
LQGGQPEDLLDLVVAAVEDAAESPVNDERVGETVGFKGLN